MKFGGRLEDALDQFANDQNGELPAQVAELKPYLDLQVMPRDQYTVPIPFQVFPRKTYPPCDEAWFQRYQLVESGNTNALRANQYVIVERTAVDDEFDTTMSVGMHSYFLAGTGQNASLISWSGTPDLEVMTPEQRQQYEKSSIPRGKYQTEADRISQTHLKAIESVNDQFRWDFDRLTEKQRNGFPPETKQ